MKVTTIQVESKRKRFSLVANGLLTSLLVSSGYVMTLPTVAVSTLVGGVALLATATYAPSAMAQNITQSQDSATIFNLTVTGSLTAASITAGTISAASINAATVSASSVVAATVSASSVVAATVSASSVVAATVSAGTVTASSIVAATVSASSVVAATVSASSVVAATVSASSVVAATVSATSITAANVSAGTVSATSITAANVSAGTVTASIISAGTISAASITAINANVSNLTAANVTAGFVTINNGLNVAPGAVVNFGGNRLQNVGNGVVATDGVNLGQLQAATTTLNRAIAGVAAMANIAPPTGMDVGEVAVGVGFGSSGGQTAVAVGVTGLISPVLSYRFSIGTGTSSGGKAVFGGGMSYTFK